jgi:hypothetical protein
VIDVDDTWSSVDDCAEMQTREITKIRFSRDNLTSIDLDI